MAFVGWGECNELQQKRLDDATAVGVDNVGVPSSPQPTIATNGSYYYSK